MTRIDIISGFLGAGKTTLIKKLLGDALKGQQVVLIENEFGEIGIDGGFLKDAGIEIREMNSGCICCSLVGDFGAALKDVITKYHPDRIIIEPSGVGKLSDVIKAVDGVEKEAGVALNSATTVVDVMKCKMYLRNFGEFFENQVKSAGTIILSRTDKADTEKVEAAVKMLRELNPEAHIITTPVEVLGGKKVLDTMEGAIINLAQVEEEEHHHHHHDHEGGEVEEYNIGTFVYYRRQPLDINKFDWMVSKKWPKNIIRAKGLCYFADEKDKCYLFEQSGVQKSIKDAGLWFATMPEDQLQEMMRRDKNLRKDWDTVYGDRMIKIVFIGQNLDRQEIADLMDTCLAD